MKKQSTILIILITVVFSCNQTKTKKVLNKTEKNYDIAINSDSIKNGKRTFIKNDTTHVYEYMNINGEEYLNQTWLKNSKGDTVGGFHYKLEKIKDTIKVNEGIILRIYLSNWMLSESSDLSLVLPVKNEKFEDDFSNLNQIKTDTVYNLKYDSANNHLKEMPLNHMLMVGYEFDTSGEKTIKGILVEKDLLTNDNWKTKERYIYFDKKIIVTD